MREHLYIYHDCMYFIGVMELPFKVCMSPGCPELIKAGAYCDKHRRDKDKQYNQYRDAEIQKLYNSTRWKKERRLFIGLHPYCECPDCVKLRLRTRATMIDHKIPHSGDAKLFWDQSNWQAMSLGCHNKKTKEEQKCKKRMGKMQ